MECKWRRRHGCMHSKVKHAYGACNFFVFFCLSLGHPVLHWQLLFIGQSTIMCRYFQVFLRTCGRQQSLLFCMACPSFTTRVGRALLCHGAFWPKQLYIATCFMEPTEASRFFSRPGPGLSLSQCRLASMLHFQISLSDHSCQDPIQCQNISMFRG